MRDSKYYMTIHSQFKMYEIELSLKDIEEVIMNGQITERQRDKKSGESKYRIRGHIKVGEMELIFKFAPDGRLAIITVYSI